MCVILTFLWKKVIFSSLGVHCKLIVESLVHPFIPKQIRPIIIRFHFQTRWTIVRCTWARLPSRAVTRPSPATTTVTCRPVLPQGSVVSIRPVRICAEDLNPQCQDSVQHPHRGKDQVNTLYSNYCPLPTTLFPHKVQKVRYVINYGFCLFLFSVW